MTSPYQILGVAEGTNLEECKKAYRILAKKYHPDTPTGNAQMFDSITKAWESLENGTYKPRKPKKHIHHNNLFDFSLYYE